MQPWWVQLTSCSLIIPGCPTQSETKTATMILKFSKAFDKFDHECLLRKLQSMGIVGKLLCWMRHYLTGRTQRVCIDGTTSEHCKVTSWVPQEAFSDPCCSSSSSIPLVTELLRTQPYISLLMMPYSTVRSSHTRTIPNYKMTSTSWWTGLQLCAWSLTRQSAKSCTPWPSTRKERHVLSLTP